MKIPGTCSILGIAGPRSRALPDFEIFLHLPQYKMSGLITQHCYKLGSLYEYTKFMNIITLK